MVNINGSCKARKYHLMMKKKKKKKDRELYEHCPSESHRRAEITGRNPMDGCKEDVIISLCNCILLSIGIARTEDSKSWGTGQFVTLNR